MDGAPYASVIIPTHDRAHTLDLAVASVQAQSVSDIEIILALDGATDGVRKVAQGLAAGDSRVRVMDMAKAPANGAANRDLAVRAARAERIFYTDDDDLWLPDHVATLGALLDDAEVAWSASLSASPSGELHIGFADYSLDAMRAGIRDDTLKLIFDTHLAHRKSTYVALGGPWADTERRTVVNLLTALAAPSGVRWRGTTTPTALSIHGASRRHLSPEARRAELVEWGRKLTLTTRPGLRLGARPEWYLQRGWRHFEGLAAADVAELYRRTGLDRLLDGLGPVQREIAEAWFGLVHRQVAPSPILAAMATRMMEPILGKRPQRSMVAGLLLAALGRDATLAMLAEAAPEAPYHAELRAVLHSYLLRRAKRAEEARALLAPYVAAPVHFAGEIWFEAAETAQVLGDVAAWRDHAARAAAVMPDAAPVMGSLILALAANGAWAEAGDLFERFRVLSPPPDLLERVAVALR